MVLVTYESAAVDRRTGLRFRWQHGFDDLKAARRHMRSVARGTMRDPFGEPWGDVRGWIES